MIDVPEWAKRAITLYSRLKMFKEIALPDAGGVLDQSELIVQILEEIYKVDKKHQERLIADERFKVFSQGKRSELEESYGGMVRQRR